MPPDLKFLLPVNHESNWTDLLAAFISNDPRPFLELVGIEPRKQVRVRREVVVPWMDEAGRRRSDRLDILVDSETEATPLAVIEAKVLSPVGPGQLDRYKQRFPGAQAYRLLQLSRFEVVPRSDDWLSLTWEQLLDAYATSEDEWVATTAHAWASQIQRFVPDVDCNTVWNDVRDDAEGDADLRARGAWLHAQSAEWCEISSDFSPADGGRSWVVSMEAKSANKDYSAYVEIDEALPVRRWNGSDDDPRPRSERLEGPTALVTLLKYCDRVNDFDWPLLVKVFRELVFDASGEPVEDGRHWRKTTAGAGSRPGWKRSVRNAKTVPMWIGHGYDMTKDGWCCFGARFDLAATATLGEIDGELNRLQTLVQSIAAAVPA